MLFLYTGHEVFTCLVNVVCLIIWLGKDLLSFDESVVHRHSEALAKLIALGLADTCSQVLYFHFVSVFRVDYSRSYVVTYTLLFHL